MESFPSIFHYCYSAAATSQSPLPPERLYGLFVLGLKMSVYGQRLVMSLVAIKNTQHLQMLPNMPAARRMISGYPAAIHAAEAADTMGPTDRGMHQCGRHSWQPPFLQYVTEKAGSQPYHPTATQALNSADKW
jgi:hypothetical protein